MDRRTFLASAGAVLLAAPLVAEAQQTKKMWRIGVLFPGPVPANPAIKGPLRQGLHDLGYVEGRDFVIVPRFAEGHQERLPELAGDLVRERVDVIVTAGTPATMAAKQATQTIPIVFAAIGFAVEKGIVASLARPGGNMTGLTTQLGPLKLYQLLKEAAPTVTRVVYLYDPDSGHQGVLERMHSQEQTVKVEWQSVAMRDSTSVEQAFAEFGRGTTGLMLDNASRIYLKADQICNLALQRKLPTIGLGRLYPAAGCLMSYAENINDIFRRAAGTVDKILKGAKPADLPVEQPTTFDLVINLKTAKALGLTIPQSLLQRADEVIR
jgi:putative tryptophan/tyrosine transport system substrate-binding protein